MKTMFVFPDMFRPHLEDTNLIQPVNYEDYDKHEYPHFYIFMQLYLGRPIELNEVAHNANIIAGISNEEIFKVTESNLEDMGATTFYTSDGMV